MKRFILTSIMALCVFSFSVPCFAEDGISVQIVAGENAATSSVQASGQVTHIITDKESKSFKINGGSSDNLKNAWKAYFGKKPNDVWNSSPSSGRDLYKHYGWPQVQTVLKVKGAKILGITSEPTIIAAKTLLNNSSVPVTENVAVSEEVKESMTHSWSDTSTIEVKQQFDYGVTVRGETTFDYTHTWGEAETVTKDLTVGSSQALTVNLQPGQSVQANLTASKGKMKVRVYYEASLTGESAANYNPTYKNHHFWNFPIKDIMNSAHLPATIEFWEDIEVGYYSNGIIDVKDLNTGKKLSSHKVSIKR